MKKITILLASAGLLLGLPSCDEWLTATSSTQISDTQLFSSRNGFQEALSGIYLCMAQPECYGRDYTWFVSDLTAFPYAAQHSNNYISLQNHNYTNAVSFPVFTSMWQSGYHAIANINKMLQELDARRDVVSDETEYRLFRGELLGLRAWIHFDILRMWGRENWDGENAGKMTVPYVRTYEKEPTVQNSYAETARMLMADVNEAISMLSADPIRGNVSESFLTTVNTNGFWDNRTRHLNYYAAKGLKARVLLWEGEHREAAELAQEIIDEVLTSETGLSPRNISSRSRSRTCIPPSSPISSRTSVTAASGLTRPSSRRCSKRRSARSPERRKAIPDRRLRSSATSAARPCSSVSPVRVISPISITRPRPPFTGTACPCSACPNCT